MEGSLTINYTSNGHNIVGTLINPWPMSHNNPEHSTTGLTLAVILHGYGMNKDASYCRELARLCQEKDMVAFCPDMYGHGESDGSLRKATISRTRDAVIDGIEHMKKEYGFEHVGLVGRSYGGLTAALVAAALPNIEFLAMESSLIEPRRYEESYARSLKLWKTAGWMPMKLWKWKVAWLPYSFWEDAVKHSAIDSAPHIKAPLYVSHGRNDQYVPTTHVSEFLASIRPEQTSALRHQYIKEIGGHTHSSDPARNIIVDIFPDDHWLTHYQDTSTKNIADFINGKYKTPIAVHQRVIHTPENSPNIFAETG